MPLFNRDTTPPGPGGLTLRGPERSIDPTHHERISRRFISCRSARVGASRARPRPPLAESAPPPASCRDRARAGTRSRRTPAARGRPRPLRRCLRRRGRHGAVTERADHLQPPGVLRAPGPAARGDDAGPVHRGRGRCRRGLGARPVSLRDGESAGRAGPDAGAGLPSNATSGTAVCEMIEVFETRRSRSTGGGGPGRPPVSNLSGLVQLERRASPLARPRLPVPKLVRRSGAGRSGQSRERRVRSRPERPAATAPAG